VHEAVSLSPALATCGFTGLLGRGASRGVYVIKARAPQERVARSRDRGMVPVTRVVVLAFNARGQEVLPALRTPGTLGPRPAPRHRDRILHARTAISMPRTGPLSSHVAHCVRPRTIASRRHCSRRPSNSRRAPPTGRRVQGRAHPPGESHERRGARAIRAAAGGTRRGPQRSNSTGARTRRRVAAGAPPSGCLTDTARRPSAHGHGGRDPTRTAALKLDRREDTQAGGRRGPPSGCRVQRLSKWVRSRKCW
jgi:hypothetical protein